MGDWEEDRNLGPWSFTPQFNKPHYNEGHYISDWDDPIWPLDKQPDIPTDTHYPWCGYWTKDYKPPTIPPALYNLYSTGNTAYNLDLRDSSNPYNEFHPCNDTTLRFTTSLPIGNGSYLIAENNYLYVIGALDLSAFGLGPGSEIISNLTVVADINDCKSVTGSSVHAFVIKNDGTLWATGSNNYGQLGLGDTIDRHYFTQVGTDTDWAEITCRSYDSIALKTDGTLWGAGWNGNGQLGLGSSTNIDTFTPIAAGNNWTSVSMGWRFTVAIKDDGSLWATGLNSSYQLCLDDNLSRNTFTKRADSLTWQKAFAGYASTLLINTDGSLYGIGYNYYGQLGLGHNNAYQTTLIQIDSDAWIDVAAGYRCTLAIKENGFMYGTGYNNNGQLGLGDIYPRNVFTQTNGSNWEFVDAFDTTHIYARKRSN